ncbi:MAG: hypothetical protein ACRDJP_15755 [Actinomycetota bacterium]
MLASTVGALSLPQVADAGPPADPCKKSGEIVVIEWDAINAAAAEFGLSPEGEFLLSWLEFEDFCDGATNDNTGFILVNGTTSNNDLAVRTDRLGEHLRWAVDLNEGQDSFSFLGTPGRDFHHFATVTTDQGDVQTFSYLRNRTPVGDLFGVELGGARGLGGRDLAWGGFEESYAPTVAAAESGGGTSPAKIPLLFKGGSGNDNIVGGKGGDTLVGSAGDDRIDGEGGKDKIKGGGGDDRCKGGPGKDKVKSCE